MTIEGSEFEQLRDSFWNEFFTVIRKSRGIIYKLVVSKLGGFPEASDPAYITDTCIADIERILREQMQARAEDNFFYKEQQRKLKTFKEDKSYVERYVLEATKSFCRKKQYYWTHGRAKADEKKGEKHRELKAGKAARVHWKGSNEDIGEWLDSLMSSEISKEELDENFIERFNQLFIKIDLSESKIECFWNRFNGMTFVEMAALDTNPNCTPDKYRKRYKRLMLQIKNSGILSV